MAIPACMQTNLRMTTNLAYILAASHSGSTLLALLLNSHPQVCTVGEMKATHMGDIACYRCSCGRLIRQCGFWARVSREMARRGLEFDIAQAGTDFAACDSRYAHRLLAPLHRGPWLESVRDAALWLSPAWRRHFRQVRLRNAALARTVCDLCGARWIVDSSKGAVRLKYLLGGGDFNIKVIHLVRDGRAVALSYMDPAGYADALDPSRRGGGMGGDRRDERLPIAQAAHQWRRSNEEAQAVVRRLPRSQWTQVRYEDYCADPRGVLRGLFGFLGLDPSAVAEDFRSREHHVLGNGMRLDQTSAIRLDDRWRSALDGRHLEVFADVAGRLNRSYQYV
jgi:hypothetical protein